MKTAGAYILASNLHKEGYYTTDSNGKLVKQKYGLFDKMIGVITNNSLPEMSYSFFRFLQDQEGGPFVIIDGSICGEFTSVFSKLSGTPLLYEKIAGGFITTDKLKNKKTLRFSDDLNILYCEYYNHYTSAISISEYKYYPFPPSDLR